MAIAKQVIGVTNKLPKGFVKQKLIFWWRCAYGKHPFSFRTRWLRRKRPMVLYWRRYGRVGGCQNLGGIAQLGERLPCKQEVTSSNLVISIWEIVLYFFSDDCTLKTIYWINDEIDCKRSISQTSECVKIGYENNILIKIEKIILNNKCLGANEKTHKNEEKRDQPHTLQWQYIERCIKG